MDSFRDSLSSQHHRISTQLDKVIAAGREGRWPDYRQLFGALRDGLQQHMAFEEEALFPVLEAAAGPAVKMLYADHARLRRQLEMLGAAAPERDPEGCVAELSRLSGLLEAHHAAEVALEPSYATRALPELLFAPEAAAAIDLRGLQPPEPIVRILRALESEPGKPLRVILPHEPLPLYGLLAERGFAYSGSPTRDGGFEVLIERS